MLGSRINFLVFILLFLRKILSKNSYGKLVFSLKVKIVFAIIRYPLQCTQEFAVFVSYAILHIRQAWVLIILKKIMKENKFRKELKKDVKKE